MRETLGRRLEVKWSLWKLIYIPTWINAGLSLVFYIVGWHLSNCAQPMPLARSGAVATAVAIGFALYDYKRKVEKSETAVIKWSESVTRNLRVTGSATQLQFEEKAKKNSQAAIQTAKIVQAMIMITATLVWGFGDSAYVCVKCSSHSTTGSLA